MQLSDSGDKQTRVSLRWWLPWQTAVQVMLNLLVTTYLLGLLQLYGALGMQESAHNSGFKDYCVRRKEMCCLLAYSESSLAQDLCMEEWVYLKHILA